MPELSITSDAWRAALLESSLDCVIIMGADGVILEMNVCTEETFGFPPASVIGRRLGDVFVPEELRQRHEVGLQRYVATRESAILGKRIEVEALHVSGRRIPVELSIVHLAGTEPPLFIGHLQNVSARRKSERRLRTSAAANEVLATSPSPEAAVAGVLRAIGEELRWPAVQFWRRDRIGNRLELAGAWVAAGTGALPYELKQGFARGEGLPGITWERGAPVWLEDIRSAAHALPRWPAFEAGGVRSAVCFPIHAGADIDGVIEAFLTEPEAIDHELVALLDALGGRLGNVHTTHEARVAIEASEAALRDALTAAEEARHAAEHANAAKDEFLAVISHELRTPLGPIMGWARLLQREDVDAGVRAKAAAAIVRNAQLESQLVEDLLDVSRMVTGKLTIERLPVSIVHIIHAAMETTATAAATKGVHVDFTGEFDVPLVLGDAKRLQQVVTNLLVNAVKFTPAGGHVEVTLSTIPGSVTMRVVDTGEGIDPALLPHIFDRFRQASRYATGSGAGLGLGLAIVRELVAGHGGTVEAFSSGPGGGATLIVTLPTAPSLWG